MDKLDQLRLYELTKILYPKHTQLDGDIFQYIDETDPTFRKKYSLFFENKDPLIDTRSIDGILDWLYGCKGNFLNCFSKEEIRTFEKVIENIEKHIVKEK